MGWLGTVSIRPVRVAAGPARSTTAKNGHCSSFRFDMVARTENNILESDGTKDSGEIPPAAFGAAA